MTCTLTPSAQAFVEALVIETQHVLSDEKLNDALRDAITNSMHEFEHPIGSPDFEVGWPYKSKASAVKLQSIWRIAIQKLLNATSFRPDPDVLRMVGLRIEDVGRLRNPRVEEASDGDISQPEESCNHAASSEDLRDSVLWLGADTHLTSQPPEPEPPTTTWVVEEQAAEVEIEVEAEEPLP